VRIYEKFSTTEYAYYSPRVPAALNGVKIVQISDLHGRMYGKNHSTLLKAVENERPAFVFITGDLIDCEREDRKIHLSLLKSLYAEYGENVCFTPGNHEHNCRSYEKLIDGIRSTGVTVLINDFLPFKDYAIFGLDSDRLSDVSVSSSAKKLEKSGKFVIGLAHKPQYIKFYSELPIDIAFSGHAHGGQIRIGSRGLFAPGQGFFPKYTCGMYKEKSLTLVVSRGLGGKTPLRINNSPELIACTLFFRD